jgi:hypothetical protein
MPPLHAMQVHPYMGTNKDFAVDLVVAFSFYFSIYFNNYLIIACILKKSRVEIYLGFYLLQGNGCTLGRPKETTLFMSQYMFSKITLY